MVNSIKIINIFLVTLLAFVTQIYGDEYKIIDARLEKEGVAFTIQWINPDYIVKDKTELKFKKKRWIPYNYRILKDTLYVNFNPSEEWSATEGLKIEVKYDSNYSEYHWKKNPNKAAKYFVPYHMDHRIKIKEPPKVLKIKISDFDSLLYYEFK